MSKEEGNLNKMKVGIKKHTRAQTRRKRRNKRRNREITKQEGGRERG